MAEDYLFSVIPICIKFNSFLKWNITPKWLILLEYISLLEPTSKNGNLHSSCDLQHTIPNITSLLFNQIQVIDEIGSCWRPWSTRSAKGRSGKRMFRAWFCHISKFPKHVESQKEGNDLKKKFWRLAPIGREREKKSRGLWIWCHLLKNSERWSEPDEL